MDSEPRSNGRAVAALILLAATATLAWRRIAARLTHGRLGESEEYNVAEVPVRGPIVRDRRRPSPLSSATGSTADEVVDLIEEADDDDAVEALLVRLNTPGGEVLPSDDVRRAAAEFDGPTVAYATDLCASGGYWIASGCDELWAHDASLVGSIGVVGSRPNAAALAEKLGISYEQFVETVSEGRDMDPDDVRETEARVYLGTDAADIGLVDDLGTREDVEERLSEILDGDVEVREFTPKHSLVERLGIGAERIAFAAGGGVASVFAGQGGDVDVELR